MVRDTSTISRFVDLAIYVLILLFTVSILYPFVYMFSVSISDPLEVGYLNVTFFPRAPITFKAYESVLRDPTLLRSYANSVLYTAVGTFCALLMSSLGGYVLSRPKFSMRTFFTILFVITMYFSGGLIPMFLNINNLGLMDTMWAVILPQAFSMWYIVIMRTNFSMLPESLFESAYIDGANDWFVYRRIVLPLSTAIIATIAVWSAVGHWNNFFGPLLYLQTPEKQTLPILLRRILVSREAFLGAEEALAASTTAAEGESIAAQGLYESLRMAVVFVTVGPIIVVYPFAQKYFTKGALVGSLKG